MRPFRPFPEAVREPSVTEASKRSEPMTSPRYSRLSSNVSAPSSRVRSTAPVRGSAPTSSSASHIERPAERCHARSRLTASRSRGSLRPTYRPVGYHPEGGILPVAQLADLGTTKTTTPPGWPPMRRSREPVAKQALLHRPTIGGRETVG